MRSMNDKNKPEPSVHISTLRLFEAAKDMSRGVFLLRDWELDHFADCKDCQSVKETFDRQFVGMSSTNGKGYAA